MEMRKIIIILLATSVSLASCVNPYTKFYRGKPNGQALNNYVPSSEPLQVFGSNNLDADAQVLEKRGYVPIGYSSFNAAANRVSDRELREQADKLGAAIVLASTHYTNTATGALPLLVPNTSTTYVNGTYGSATATTYGSETVMVPFSIRRNDFSAVYFVKVRPHFGVMYGVIDPATRTRLQTNAGVLAKVIVDGTPASAADILPGDIILTADGQRVDGVEQLNEYLKLRVGQPVVFGIDRNGTRLEKTVTLLP
jgi:serine protease Do